MTTARIRRDLRAPAIVTVFATATIAAAWAFELIGGFVPCALCLKERIPYYVGIPIAVAALFFAYRDAPIWLNRILLIAIAVVFAYGAGLGIYHAGAEWSFWPGPVDCAPGSAHPTTSATDLLSQLESIRIVSCSEASWRFPANWGLSFAGWNAAASLFFVAVAAWGAMTIKARSP